MSDVINLRQHRKQKARTEKEKKAEQNRSKFGRTKSEKQRDLLKAEQQNRHLDAHKLDKSEE